jgi:RNA:NAD 2'-phosphotransferase (TPT1/KptA family)
MEHAIEVDNEERFVFRQDRIRAMEGFDVKHAGLCTWQGICDLK